MKGSVLFNPKGPYFKVHTNLLFASYHYKQSGKALGWRSCNRDWTRDAFLLKNRRGNCGVNFTVIRRRPHTRKRAFNWFWANCRLDTNWTQIHTACRRWAKYRIEDGSSSEREGYGVQEALSFFLLRLRSASWGINDTLDLSIQCLRQHQNTYIYEASYRQGHCLIPWKPPSYQVSDFFFANLSNRSFMCNLDTLLLLMLIHIRFFVNQ